MIYSGKKILFIAPNFFNYEVEIKNELEKMGAKVDYYNERPSNTVYTKALIRLNLKTLINSRIKKYYKNIVQATSNTIYDYVLMVNIEAITEDSIKSLKYNQENSQFILYMWDSMRNKKRCFELINYFDKVYTFDQNDLILDKKIKFKSLFYINDYRNISEKTSCDFDLSFIGTAHSDRYNLLKKIEKQAFDNNLRTYFFFYYHSKVLFWLRKIFDKNFKKVLYSDFSFKPLSRDEVIEIISNSKCVVDIQHPKQTGLTMRCIEVLGAQKKIITTNKDIINYDFYKKENINIIERQDPKIDIELIKSKYEGINKKIYFSYSITAWLEDILS